MASYAVHMRIEGVRPTRQGGSARRARTAALGASPGAVSGIDAEAGPVDVVGRSTGEVVAERWLRICEAWSQTTFFLFDPDSWR